ncbi:prepilin-type N-terminal cleavage/methylation domain-containing protein [Sulfurimonas sp.]|uniref:prepilin-type N-terminal cleavage/methylation domain-containing protein n=1 Tax=Sulfurimonas sp. TaxID=2022749 RepID=UPI00356233AA
MKKAFSLIELIIVILIIGIVYTISVGNFEKVKDETEKLTLENLKEYLQGLPHEKSAELLCLYDCSKCKVLVDGEKFKELDDFLDKSVRSYRYDFSYGMVEVEKDDDVCFSYSVDKKGIGQQVIVEYKDLFYDFSTYLSPVGVYNSLQEATDAKVQLSQEVLR